MRRDPLVVARDRLTALGVAEEQIAAADDVPLRRCSAAIDEAKAAPAPDPSEALHRRLGRRGCGMADVITYRDAVAEGIAREMRRDSTVVCLGEDIGAAEGVFKTTVGLFEEFGGTRVWDTPISEQAIVGAAFGAAMTGMRPVAEIMFSDFIACCYDYLANEIPKMRYMTGGQVTVPLVIRTANGGGLGFGAQHSQAVENWVFTVPGLKIVAPSNASRRGRSDGVGDPQRRPRRVLRAQGIVRQQGRAGTSRSRRAAGRGERRPARRRDVTLVALASTVSTALAAAEQLQTEGISAEVVDLRCLVPLDVQTVLTSVERTSRLVIVEENPYQGGWGGTVVSIVADEGFESLDAPIRRVAAACVPLPFADVLEDEVIPTVAKVVDAVRVSPPTDRSRLLHAHPAHPRPHASRLAKEPRQCHERRLSAGER